MIAFRPAFSPVSCYMLRNQDEVDYFAGAGGAPEAQMIRWARSLLGPNDVFVDVGAHVGTWAQDLAQHCAGVMAFEPQQSTYHRLREGVRLAALDDKITCYRLALSAVGQRFRLLSHVSEDGGGSTLRHRAELGNVLHREHVSTETLDYRWSVAWAGADDPGWRLGLLKLDVEGHEREVLEGARKTIAEHRPHILAEAWLHSWYANDRLRLRHLIESMNYTVDTVPGWPEMLWGKPRS